MNQLDVNRYKYQLQIYYEGLMTPWNNDGWEDKITAYIEGTADGVITTLEALGYSSYSAVVEGRRVEDALNSMLEKWVKGE